MIKEVAFFAYPVTDVPKARSFYEETLGLKVALTHEIDPSAGIWWIEYDVAGVALALSNAWAPAGNAGTAAFEVDDLDAALEKFKAAGTTIAFEPMDTPGCRFFGIKDPDGNDLLIHQRKPQHP